MAKIAQSKKAVNTFWVLEDPRSISSAIYIQGEAHDHSSLAPIFAKSCTTETNGTQTTQMGSHFWTAGSTDVNTNNTRTAGQPFASLLLTKGSTSVQQSTTGGNAGNKLCNLDMNWLQSIDPAYIPKGLHEYDNSTSKAIWHWNIQTVGRGFGDQRTIQGYNDNQELYDLKPQSAVGFTTWSGAASGYGIRVILPWVDANNRVPYIGDLYSRGDNSGWYLGFRLGYLTFPVLQTLGVPESNFNVASISLTAWWGQFLGLSTAGTPLFFVNNSANDNEMKVVNYNIAANTTSYLYEWSTTRSAFGGAVGGARTTTAGIRLQNKFASTFFNDPNVANTKGFYVPYFDTNNNYQPFYFQWNTTNDTFTKNDNVLVVTETVNNTFSASSAFLNDLTSTINNQQGGMSGVVFNETFTVSTTRYLMLGAINGVYQVHDSADSKRTFITYQVNASDPTVLVYHSHLVFPTTPKNIVWLNDSKTLMGVFLDTAFKIYNFTTATGWVESQTIAEKFWSVGRDRSDRIWGVSQSAIDSYTELHLITPTIPITINIVPELTTYNYQGSTINSYFTLEAINAQGNRVATDVTLVIDGSTMTFADNTKSKIITTSDSATVQVNIKVIDSGFSQIIASVTV